MDSTDIASIDGKYKKKTKNKTKDKVDGSIKVVGGRQHFPEPANQNIHNNSNHSDDKKKNRVRKKKETGGMLTTKTSPRWSSCVDFFCVSFCPSSFSFLSRRPLTSTIVSVVHAPSSARKLGRIQSIITVPSST